MEARFKHSQLAHFFSSTRFSLLGLLMALVVFSGPSLAADLSFTGDLPHDDAVLIFEFSVAAPADVTLRTYSYAGGTNANGQIIPAGGFDPILSVFDDTGAIVGSNDDGSGVPSDPVTGAAFDTLLELTTLPAGQYTVALSQFSNSPAGPNFSDGFTGSGTSGFVDITGTTRTSAWAFDMLNVDSGSLDDVIIVRKPASVPTLNELMLIALTLLLATLGGLMIRSKSA